MKLHTERSEVERSGVGSEARATIKATAKAFDILSNGLYPDPKLAVVRELSCNAYDSHVAAGKANEPFEIHLPNSLEPYLSIRDRGTGLSHDDVMALYLDYFNSTKTDSNEYIGALGLGSKSPFAYSNAYEVISTFNGKRRTYSVFKDEEGLPSRACLGEFDTDEPNGFEVRITIQPGDFWAFAEKTAKSLRWFPVKPTVVGNNSFKWLELPKQRLEGEGWKMFETNFTGDYSKMTAVQGNVGYKVDVSKLGLNTGDTRILENSHVVGFFDIGDLEVAANREEIRYDDKSRKALIAKITEVRAGVLKSIEDAVDVLADKPFWNVVIELNSIALKIFNDKRLFKEFVKNTKNALILKYLKIDGELKLSSLKGHEISAFEQAHGKEGRTIRRRHFGEAITPESHMTVFYNDLPSGGVARVMEWVKTKPSDPTYRKPPVGIVIRPMKEYNEVSANADGTLSKKAWTQQDFNTEYDRLYRELGNVDLIMTSTLPAPVRGKSTYKGELPIFQFDGIQGKYNSYIVWKRTPTIDLTKGGLYFNLQNGAHIAFLNKKGDLQNVNWSHHSVEGNFQEAVKMINTHLNMKYTVKDIYGFGSQAIGKLKKHANWINLFDVLRESVKGFDEADKFFRSFHETSDVHGVKSRVMKIATNDGFRKLVDELDTKSTFRKAVLPLIEDFSKYGKHSSAVHFAKQINVDLQLGLFDNKGKGYYGDKAFVNYPMFRFIDNLDYQSTAELKLLFDYIQLIDRS